MHPRIHYSNAVLQMSSVKVIAQYGSIAQSIIAQYVDIAHSAILISAALFAPLCARKVPTVVDASKDEGDTDAQQSIACAESTPERSAEHIEEVAAEVYFEDDKLSEGEDTPDVVDQGAEQPYTWPLQQVIVSVSLIPCLAGVLSPPLPCAAVASHASVHQPGPSCSCLKRRSVGAGYPSPFEQWRTRRWRLRHYIRAVSSTRGERFA